MKSNVLPSKPNIRSLVPHLEGKKIVTTQTLQSTTRLLKAHPKDDSDDDPLFTDALRDNLLSKRSTKRRDGGGKAKKEESEAQPGKSPPQLKQNNKSKQSNMQTKSQSRLGYKPAKKERKSDSPSRHYKSNFSGSKQKKNTLKDYTSNYHSKLSKENIQIEKGKVEKTKVKAKRDKHKPKFNLFPESQFKSLKPVKSVLETFLKIKQEINKENIVARKGKPKRTERKIPKTKRVGIDQQSDSSLIQGEVLQQRYKNQVYVPKERLSFNQSKPKRIINKMSFTQTEGDAKFQKKKKRSQKGSPKKSPKKSPKGSPKRNQSPGISHKNESATRIQKCFRGFLTRKYLRQCLENHAARKIQNFWRRRKMQNEKKGMRQEEYLLHGSPFEKEMRQEELQNWKGMLEEILKEQNIKPCLREKIKSFLVQERKSGSSRSSQIVESEIHSERRFMEDSRKKESPREKQSPRHPYRNSLSPKYFTPLISQGQSSPELVLDHLMTVQNFHREKLILQAKHQKQVLSAMMGDNMYSPKTFQAKVTDLDSRFVQEMSKFEESLGQVIESCKQYQNELDSSSKSRCLQIDQAQTMVTPQRNPPARFQWNPVQPFASDISPSNAPSSNAPSSNAPSSNAPSSNAPPSHLVSTPPQQPHQSSPQQVSVEMSQYGNSAIGLPGIDPFDSSYTFIEEYLISLIQYLRTARDGLHMREAMQILQIPRSLEVTQILKHLYFVTESVEGVQNVDSLFRLPMYKYLETDRVIFSWEIIEQFNGCYERLQRNTSLNGSNLQDCFIKMIADSFNSALNSLRPSSSIFTEHSLDEGNYFKRLKRTCQAVTNEDASFQVQCARAMQILFLWSRLQCGKLMECANQLEEDALREARDIAHGKDAQMQVQSWLGVGIHLDEELVEVIANFGAMVFDEIVEQESQIIAWALSMGFEQDDQMNS